MMSDEELLRALNNLVLSDLEWVFDETLRIMNEIDNLSVTTALRIAFIMGEDMDIQS